MRFIMKFRCDPTDDDYYDKRLWHKWFAWHPVYVGNNEYVWLEFVYRSVTWSRTYYTRNMP
jgi:hypothetical protein